MPRLTPREQRTIRFAAVAMVLYLALFYGVRGWRHLESSRAGYEDLARQAQRLEIEWMRYENKVLLLEKLRGGAGIQLASLSPATLAGEASAAIQAAAQSSGVKLGPIRESPGSPAARELTAMQLEGTGPVPGVMGLIHRLKTLGFPLLIESIQLDPDSKKPGELKLVLRVVLLDFDRWKREERTHG